MDCHATLAMTELSRNDQLKIIWGQYTNYKTRVIRGHYTNSPIFSSSFPRRRESRVVNRSDLLVFWIPAFAGMTLHLTRHVTAELRAAIHFYMRRDGLPRCARNDGIESGWPITSNPGAVYQLQNSIPSRWLRRRIERSRNQVET
jgi:hypothetical protein